MAFPLTNIVLFLLLCFTISVSSSSSSSSSINEEKQQDTIHDQQKVELAPQDHHVGIKCGSCPCVNPCGQKPPSPPPPPPPKTPCSPVAVMAPPPPRFVYVTSLPEQPWQANIIPNNNNDWQYFYNTAPGRKIVPWSYFLCFSVFWVLQLLAFG